MVRGSNNCQLSEAIENLSPELREIIYKEYVAIKLRQRKEMGWNEVHDEFDGARYCEKQGRISKTFICRKCNTCWRTGLCVECFKNNVKHYLVEEREDVNKFEEKFLKYYWCVGH